MHELSLAVSILEILECEIAQRSNGMPRGRVPSLTVRVGSLSGIEPEALSFAWDVARDQGSFPEAELLVEVSDGSEITLTRILWESEAEPEPPLDPVVSSVSVMDPVPDPRDEGVGSAR